MPTSVDVTGEYHSKTVIMAPVDQYLAWVEVQTTLLTIKIFGWKLCGWRFTYEPESVRIDHSQG